MQPFSTFFKRLPSIFSQRHNPFIAPITHEFSFPNNDKVHLVGILHRRVNFLDLLEQGVRKEAKRLFLYSTSEYPIQYPQRQIGAF